MKILTILGTRPEIIRLSLIIERLDRHADHVLVHTGQNNDKRLSDLFFRELGVRPPDEFLNVSGATFGAQAAEILARSEALLLEHRPDRVLILGDTNSGLAAIVARRLGVPVYHMEAGNRCYDFRVPEESNRRIIDHVSSVLMPYTERSRANLLREGIAAENIFVTGNPIYEVMQRFAAKIGASTAFDDYRVREKEFFLVTLHRAENVDVEERLRGAMEAFGLLHERYGMPVVCSLHPHTRSKLKQFDIGVEHQGLRFVEPIGFFDFVRLEQGAFCVLTDSGTVQEETCIQGVPNVTLRDVTERPETIECGSNVLAGCDPGAIVNMVELVTRQSACWQPPPEYLREDVANTSVRVLLGRNNRAATARVTPTVSPAKSLKVTTH